MTTTTTQSFLNVVRRALGSVSIGAAGLCVLGALSACTPSQDKNAFAQEPSFSALVDTASIQPVAEEWNDTASTYSKTNGGVTITVYDQLKPGNEILVSAQCGADTHAQLSSSLTTDKVDMSPAADMGELIGTLKAPAQIGAGPQDGYHTVTVACDSGKTGTITLNSAGNGDHRLGVGAVGKNSGALG